LCGSHGVALIDMTGWVVGDPGLCETDAVVEEAINACGQPSEWTAAPTML
jgi:hypothetical protein